MECNSIAYYICTIYVIHLKFHSVEFYFLVIVIRSLFFAFDLYFLTNAILLRNAYPKSSFYVQDAQRWKNVWME